MIQLSPGEHESRAKIGLGRMTKKLAETAKLHVEKLVNAKGSGGSLETGTVAWIADLPPKMRRRLESLGLLTPQAIMLLPTLGVWVERYRELKAKLKPASRYRLKHTGEYLVEHFEATTELGAIGHGGAADWADWLSKDRAEGGKGLSEPTVRQHIRNAKSVFGEAVDRGYIAKNPFRKLASSSLAAGDDHYVTPDEAQQVLEACPSLPWKVFFGLMRYAGLRAPSETHSLTWDRVDFGRGILRVRSVKTERHRKHRSRQVPI
jgi:integrase